eukprot:s855_g13.t1
MELRIAPVGVVYTQATQAHLRRSGCKSGVPLDRFMPFSLFRWAHPPIKPGSFLVKVDETELDTFGMGKRLDYMQQYVSFKDLLTFREHLDDIVTVTTCTNGIIAEHRLSLKWNSSRFEGGVRYLYEPNFDETAKDYEWFSGLTMVQLTLNHIDAWIAQLGGETLGRFYLEENTLHPRVAITSCASGFSCEEIVGTGMIVESINGNLIAMCLSCPVSTLADIRRCFIPKTGLETWELVTDRGVALAVDFQEEMSQADLTLLSKAVREAALWLRNSSSRRAAETGKQKRGGDKDTKNHSNATNSSGNLDGKMRLPKNGGRGGTPSSNQGILLADLESRQMPMSITKMSEVMWTTQWRWSSISAGKEGDGCSLACRLAAPLIPQDSHDALLSRHAKQPDIERETAVQKAENLSSAPNDTTTKSHTAHSKHPMRTGHKHRKLGWHSDEQTCDAQARVHGNALTGEARLYQADATHTEKTKEPREVEQEKLRAKYNMQVTPTGSSMPFQVGKPGA